MANYYRILSAYSDDGEDLSVPVPWNLDSVDDLSVVIVGDSGKPQEIDYWNWDSQLKQIEIPNSQNFKVWRAYVYRKEDAVALFQLIESHEINAQNILEQFQKISRILESLQENEKTFLSSPDYMGGLLPNASHRASKFVSFDEDGKPVCDIPTETFDDAVRFMEKAVGEAEEAFGEIVTAKTAEFNSNAASKKEEINTLAAQAETSKNAAITAANGATAAAQAAATSQTAAAASKTSAEESATEAQGFAQAAASSQTAAAQSETNAQASATAAAESATQAQTAAQQAQAAATQAQTSETNAAASATQAQASAQAAASSQTAAAQSESNAQTSATAAAGSATQAQTSATQAQAAQAAAETAAQIAQATDAGKLALDKLSAGTLYFNNAKLFGSNFAIPNFPFSICATVRVDSWEGSTQGIQTIFQFGNNGTGALWGSIWFNNVINNPGIVLRISNNTDGTLSYSEVSYFFDKDTFLGKEHTIIGVCRELESTPVNFDIYVDGAKVATSPYKGLTLDSLSGTVNYAVNTYNANYSVQPASAHPMMLRNLYVFNFDVSAPAAPYSIADYVAGRLIPPALKPSQVSLALENYTIARNATTKLVKDASGNSNDATVQGSGTVAGDNDQSIKAFVDEIKTQINQSNG